MRAIVFEQSGQPEDVLSLKEIPPPIPQSGQVLIKVVARPIQPADFLFIGGRYRIKPVFPQPAGLEGTGTIVDCAPEITHLKKGMRVAFRSPGAWAEFAVAPASRVYPVPADVPDDIAGQFALNPITAWGLLSECNLQPSSRILITAGRSIVARLLTQLARHKGLEVTLLVREKGGYTALNGNNNQVIANGATVAETLQDAVKNGHFHAILDSVGGADSLALMDALESRGRLVSYGILSDTDITIRASRVLLKNLIWQGFGIDGWLDNATAEQIEAAQNELWALLLRYPELLPVTSRFDLSQIQEAVRATYGTHSPGKVMFVG